MAQPDTPRPGKRIDLSRLLFLAISTIVVVGGAYVLGMSAGAAKSATYYLWTDLRDDITQSFSLLVTEAPTLTGTRPTHFLQESRYDGDGVTVNKPSNDQADLILLEGFFDQGNELRLIHRNGDVVARWPVSFHQLIRRVRSPAIVPEASSPATDWNIDLHGALALPDGSVVFNFEYGGTVKLDRCNQTDWTLLRRTHHSVEPAEDGGFWIPGRRDVVAAPSPYPPFRPPFQEDTVLHVSDDGEVLSEFSVVKLLYDNGLEPVLTATGESFLPAMQWDHEVLHLNKVAELSPELAPDFPMFEAGDLVLSIRTLNLVLVADKTGSRVKWWQIGPWRRQHDPEFAPGGRLIMFNNNLYSDVFVGTDRKTPADTPRVSQVLRVDPKTGATDVAYGGPGQELLSATRGKVALTPSGGLFVTEADGGRVFETDANGEIVWEYVNKYDDENVAEIGEARLYPADYFTFDTGAWPCQSR